MILAVLVLTVCGKGIAMAQSPWTEAWNSATAGTYSFDIDGEALVPGDRGVWHIQDVVGAPSGNQVAIESVGGDQRLKLTCVNGGGLQASLMPLNIALTSGTRLAISESGSLINPYWNGAFPTVFPPPGDNVHLMLQDNRGNMLVYLFQRAANYPAHNTTLNYLDENGQPVTLGYREVFVDSPNVSGGSYLLNLYNDFSAVTGFVPAGASISFIEFMASGTPSGTGVATMDDLQIGTALIASSPSVTVQPQNQTVRYGERALFEALVSGTSPFTYQWLRNGSNVVGGTQMMLTISNATLAAQGDYSVVVTNQVGTVTSLVATLTVDARPYILTQPVGRTVESGDAVNLSVSAGGAPTLTYQWQRDGSVLPGQTGSTLNIPSASTTNTGTYSVVVSNSFGFTQSLAAVLTVLPPLTLGDAVDAPILVWTNGGTLTWKPQRVTTFDGVDALEVGPGPGTAWIETVVSGPGILSFRWRTSKDPLRAYVSLFVNDILQTTIAGITNWQEVRLALGAEPCRVRWLYTGGSYISPSNEAWLDQVTVLPRATSTAFANTNAIQFPYQTFAGSGNPYPSVINVSGMVNDVTEVVVHLKDLSMDTDGGGLDLLLVAPSGETSIVMSDAARLFAVSHATLQIDDLWLTTIPRDSSFSNGVFLPTDYPRPNDAFPQDSFPSAPAGPWPHSLASLRGANPNGEWQLFARYGSPFGGSGQLAGGWSLELLTRRDAIRLENARLWGSEAQFVLIGPPNAGFVIQVTSNMVDWVPLLTNSIPANGWYAFFDDSASDRLSRFYRTVAFAPIPPDITSQPQSQSVNGGDDVSFSVTATSFWPLNYQWKKNNSPIVGATNATLILTSVQGSHTGNYNVAVGNGFFTVDSSSANLSVVLSSNDMFTNRFVLTGLTNAWAGSNFGATIEPGEPNHAGPNPFGLYGGKSVWWTWMPPVDGLVTLGVSSNPNEDTFLAVYTGNTVSTLTRVIGRRGSGDVSFVVTAGTAYQIAMDIAFGGSGAFNVDLREAPAGPPVITAQPQSQIVAVGSNVTFNVVASSPWPMTYQWRTNNTAIGGATNGTLTLLNVQNRDAVSYDAVVSNAYGTVISSNATLTVVTVPNDAFTNRLVITGMTNTLFGTNAVATKEASEPLHAGITGGKSVWWTWTAPTNGTVIVDTIGSSFNTLLAVYTGTSVSALSTVASDDNSGGNFASKLTFSASAGTTYQVAVDGYFGASGNIVLHVQQIPPPANDLFANRVTILGMTNTVNGSNSGATKEASEPNHAGNAGGKSVWWTWTAPTNGTVIVDTIGSSFNTLLAVYTGGSVASLSPVASDDQSGGNNTSKLTFNPTTGTTYQIAVDGSSGASGAVILNLKEIPNSAPAITTQPQSRAVPAGSNVTFSVTATGTLPLKYQWRRDEVNIGSATNTSYIIVGAQTNHAGAYSVMVSNSYGSVTSAVAVLTVTPRLLDTFNPAANSIVNSMAIQADGKILLGGAFTTIGGQPRNRIARFNADGSLDNAFNPGADNFVWSLAFQSDGKILVGGWFTMLGGQPRNHLGRLNADGSLDVTFNAGANTNVNSLALQPDGKILVGGIFTTLGGQPRNYLGRLNADGSLDTSFNPGANATVNSLTLQPDGKILVGGNFTTLGDQPRNYLGRLVADGSLDTAFNPEVNSGINCLAIQADGKILVAGLFSALGGQTPNYLGRINADGSLDISFNPGAGKPFSVAVQADGKILVGGFTGNYLTRFSADGSLDPTFNPGASSIVFSLAMQADAKILVGGNFTTLDGQPRNYFGRLNNTAPASQSLTLDGSTLTWLRGGTSPEVWRTTFEVSTNGANWASLGVGSRVAGGWQLTGVAAPPNASIRARGYASGGYLNGSSWFVETIIQP
ncbi:MAG: immunoglobulin domain-containing protein [Verrucomicrobia bacterium]|nr:immunoglobulin domain-containing protein [Verrucomicrobiota bacterium]